MIIRRLERKDEKKLAEFLGSLGKDSLLMWNRFGNITKEYASDIAKTQVSRDKKEEIGYVAEENQIILGYGFLRFFPEKPQKKTTCNLGVTVSDKHQGKGIGKKLLDYMINDARAAGMRKVWLGTYTTNARALNMYKKKGFQVEGIFMADEFFDGTPFHTVSMALFLDGTGEEQKEKRQKIIQDLAGSV